MTLIEFMDRTAVENVVGALSLKPDRVIFVCRTQESVNWVEHYRKLFQQHGLETAVESMLLDFSEIERELPYLVERLENLLKTWENCEFDLTGGEELYLTAVGILIGKYGDSIQCHRFSLLNEKLIDCDGNGNTGEYCPCDLTIEDLALICGGEIVWDPARGDYTYDWDFNPEFVQDIQTMWWSSMFNPGLWNKQMEVLGEISRLSPAKEPLTIAFEPAWAKANLKDNRYCLDTKLLERLAEKKLLKLEEGEGTVTLSFKNEQVMKCLTMGGQVLELMTAVCLRSFKDARGERVFHDVRVGVVLDWDGADTDGTEKPDPTNEIDVIAMKGAVPVLVSCKNGSFKADELYKVNAVAARFGGDCAKTVLVSSWVSLNQENVNFETMDTYELEKYRLRRRAEAMDIRLISSKDIFNGARYDRSLNMTLTGKIRSRWYSRIKDVLPK